MRTKSSWQHLVFIRRREAGKWTERSKSAKTVSGLMINEVPTLQDFVGCIALCKHVTARVGYRLFDGT